MSGGTPALVHGAGLVHRAAFDQRVGVLAERYRGALTAN